MSKTKEIEWICDECHEQLKESEYSVRCNQIYNNKNSKRDICFTCFFNIVFDEWNEES